MLGDRLLMRRFRREESGFTLVELMIASFIGAAVMAMAGGFVVSAARTGIFAEGQSITINDVRTAVDRMSREIRGSDAIKYCEPAGSCLQVGAQKATGGFRTVRYTHSGDELKREVQDPDTGEWGTSLIVIERVANGVTQPVFRCDIESSLLKVNIDLRIQPTPHSSPVLNVQTAVSPRNFPSKARCL